VHGGFQGCSSLHCAEKKSDGEMGISQLRKAKRFRGDHIRTSKNKTRVGVRKRRDVEGGSPSALQNGPYRKIPLNKKQKNNIRGSG